MIEIDYCLHSRFWVIIIKIIYEVSVAWFLGLLGMSYSHSS